MTTLADLEAAMLSTGRDTVLVSFNKRRDDGFLVIWQEPGGSRDARHASGPTLEAAFKSLRELPAVQSPPADDAPADILGDLLG